MAYGTTAGVEALVPAVGLFYGDTLPTREQVEAWLDQGAAVINRTLSGAGYVTPVANTSAVYPELTALNELYAAAYVVMARGLDTVSGQNENRSGVWMQQFQDRLDALAATALPDVPTTGATSTASRRFRTTAVKRVDGYSRVWDDVDVDT